MAESDAVPEINDQVSTSDSDLSKKYSQKRQDVNTGVMTRARQRELAKQDPESKENPESSSSDKEKSEKPADACPICFTDFTDQEVGIPENCKHTFCLECVLKWSKQNNSCPIDRKVFRKIHKKRSIKSAKPYSSVKVDDNRLQIQLEEDFLQMINADVSCRICGRDDQEDLLLICDDCGNGYHTFCLALPGVPTRDDWLCPLCEVDQLSAAEDLYEDSELEDLNEFVFDDIMEDVDIETEATAPTRNPRVRQTARMRTGGARNQQTASPVPVPPTRHRRRRQPTRRITRTRRPNAIEQHRRRSRNRRVVRNFIQQRLNHVNGDSASDPPPAVLPDGTPRLFINQAEPIALEELIPFPSFISRSVISPSEAARRIVNSGVPIAPRRQNNLSINRELSIRTNRTTLERAPSRTIRTPAPPRIPISQLPRIQRRPDAPVRTRSANVSSVSTPIQPVSSFLDDLLNSQARMLNRESFQVQGAHIRIL